MTCILFPSRCRRAFTLIELLVVIVIISILVGIALPVFNQFVVKSRQTQTLSNMRQVGAAFLLYAGDNNSQLPGRVVTTDKWPKLMSAYVQNVNVYNSPIPPYVGKQITDPTQLISNSPNNTNYIGNGYNDINGYNNETIAPRLSTIPMPSQTLLLAIKLQTAQDFYMDFVENNESNAIYTTTQPWPAGSVYVFCDGSSRLLQYPPAGTNMSAKPTNAGFYTDWLWLINKT